MKHAPALQGTALEQAGAVVTETSLHLRDPRSLTWEQYERLGLFLGTLGQAYCWWVGDLLIAGEEIFGEEFAQIEASLPHSEHTLKNYRWIAKAIPPSRRRANLGFGVHEAVAALPPEDRERWLDLAERNAWKRQDMRNALRASRERGELPQTTSSVDQPVVTGNASGIAGEPVPSSGRFCPHCGGEL